jgi:hypothetical protein
MSTQRQNKNSAVDSKEIEKLDKDCAKTEKMTDKLEKIVVKNEKDVKAIDRGIKECQGFADWIEKIMKTAQQFKNLEKFTAADIRAVKASYSAKEFKRPTTTNGLRHAIVATQSLLASIFTWHEENKDKLDSRDLKEIEKLVKECRSALKQSDDHIKLIDEIDERRKSINELMENAHENAGDIGKMIEAMPKKAKEDMAHEIQGVTAIEVQLVKNQTDDLAAAGVACDVVAQFMLSAGVLYHSVHTWCKRNL